MMARTQRQDIEAEVAQAVAGVATAFVKRTKTNLRPAKWFAGVGAALCLGTLVAGEMYYGRKASSDIAKAFGPDHAAMAQVDREEMAALAAQVRARRVTPVFVRFSR